MPLYEHVFLARQDVSSGQVEALAEKFSSLITGAGGTIAKTEHWGLKTLAYRIKKNRKAHFTLLNIDAGHEAVTEMERQMGLDSDVIRFLTLSVDEHEEGPSAAMQSRSGRDDHRGRRGGRQDDNSRRPAPRRDGPAPGAADARGKSDAPETGAKKESE